MKKVLIINGHPDKTSLCFALAESYKRGVDLAGGQSKLIHLIDLNFNPILTNGYKEVSELEPDLVQTQKDIIEAEHLVFVYPNWWSTYPALLKGFIDRVFLPGFSFRYRKDSPFWEKLLKGKSARLIVTLDTPAWYYWLFNKNTGHNSMKIGILEFSGIAPVRITTFAPVKTSNLEKRKKWIKEVEELGKNGD